MDEESPVKPSFFDLWESQKAQQFELGLAPDGLSYMEKRGVLSDLLLSLHEEVGELQRAATPGYKRHLLNSNYVLDHHNVALEVVDVLKMLMAIAQMLGLEAHEVTDAFVEKTKVVKAMSEGERSAVRESTVLCVDMDDVICDMAQWHLEEMHVRGALDPGGERHAAEEEWKDKWFRSGRFRDVPPVEGAVEALREVQSWGWKIVIVTARPQSKYRRIHADTLHWFEKHGFQPDLILFGKDKVELVHTHLNPAWPVAFVEDHERNARALSAAGIEVLLFDRPKNRKMEFTYGVSRVYSWEEILVRLKRKRNVHR